MFYFQTIPNANRANEQVHTDIPRDGSVISLEDTFFEIESDVVRQTNTEKILVGDFIGLLKTG